MSHKICVVGLGYVGLPLAVALGKAKFQVTGFDVNKKRISELKRFTDSSEEVNSSEIKESRLSFTSDESEIKTCDFIIVCVPTPITKNKIPDLKYVESASEIVGRNIQKNAIVVYESTVYPGVTEDICLPILERESGLKCPGEFKIGYSPERINPADKEHTIDKIIKVVSGIDEDALEVISEVYSKVTKAGIFKAESIKVAEAAKVIENIQRDLNIALVNELALIFHKLGIDTSKVLEASSTKWNFHKYTPGLVGGHCIGVDPYYLTFKAQELGFHPQIILAGRSTNDFMPRHVADLVIRGLNDAGKVIKKSKVVLFGLTFKDDLKDPRNSKAKDIIDELRQFNVNVAACEPKLEKDTIKELFGVEHKDYATLKNIDCAVILNNHKEFRDITLDNLNKIMTENPVIVDIKNKFDKELAKKKGYIYSRL